MHYGKTVLWAAGVGLAAIVTQPAASAPAKSAATAMRSTDLSAQQRRRPPTRITVVPLSRYYRQCDSWLAVEHRLSGDVITPQQHCWWTPR